MENMGVESAAIELLFRILCDTRPEYPVNGAYLYCQTEGNQRSLFQTALFLFENALTAKILIVQTGAKSGYPGYAQWKSHLQKAGLTEEHIEGVEIQESPILHTLIESKALVRFARQQGYTSLLVIAPPFQQLRAYMTAVTVALREYPDLFLYSYPAVAMPWQEEVVHSQGTLKATRSELIHIELEKIGQYQDKGDLASCQEVLAYLDRRQVIS